MLSGYLVKGKCGREWFVPIEKVGEDYADFLAQADCLTPEDALKKSNLNRDFWPVWFAEQCYLWGDIERLGTLVKKTGLFKTKAALDRCRGGLMDAIDDYEEVTQSVPSSPKP